MTNYRFQLIAVACLCGAVLCSLFLPGESNSDASVASRLTKRSDSPRKPLRVGHPTFASPHANPIAVSGDSVFVANTPADTVDVIDANTKKVLTRVNVGIDPVSIAVRPDGREIWVSNHVSDSVSVIDIVKDSPTYLQVIATIQEFNPKTKATMFDEPMGIAFANNQKAYVALSSENQIAVIDVEKRNVTKRLRIPAQDPRSIVVHGERLFVIPFESNNKTQLSGGAKKDIDGELVTFDAWEHSIRVNNVLSLGHITDIVKHPDVPDRDLFVFDTKTDKLVETVDTLGTLLYGITVDSKGRVFIAQTDARNDANGRAGTKKHGIKEMENRAFLNQITKVDFSNGKSQKPEFLNLEPLPPKHPEKGMALATPYAITVSGDDSTLVASAAGSDKVFTVDAQSGKVLGRVPVGAVPRGIALVDRKDGKPSQAWVYNVVANTVSVVDVSDVTSPKIAGFVKLKDPTHRQVKLGRTWFNDADASSFGTFSCESCHPDNNTDQLLWVLKTPIVTGANQIMPRSTMPVRGLRDTAPYHWDGVLGDPYGGINSANIFTSVEPTADPEDQTTSTRHLVDVSMAEILMAHGDDMVNDEGKPGGFTAAERDDLAVYLLSVSYPPAQRRAYTNELSERAKEGFKKFHILGDVGGTPGSNLCGNCHRMPFNVSTNTPGTGMEATTWRGAYDRFLILPQGRLNIVEFDFYRRIAQAGNDERSIWRFSWGGRQAFDSVWDMVLEQSTGYSGSFARQITLNTQSTKENLTTDLLNALETSASEGAVVLEGEGVLITDGKPEVIEFQFDPEYQGGTYVSKARDRQSFSREQLLKMAENGEFIGTFTGRHGENADVESPQPALWTLGTIHEQRGRQDFPILHAGTQTMAISGRNFDDYATVYVDGHLVKASVEVTDDEQERVVIELEELPESGMHTLQVQAESGLFSNDFIFHVTSDAKGAQDLKRSFIDANRTAVDLMAIAIKRNDVDELKRLINKYARRINDRRPATGSTLLVDAAFRGNLEIVKLLLSKGAKVDTTNRDGNTPLIVAAFMCRTEVVKHLLEKGASTNKKNSRGDTAVKAVSGDWSQDLEELYKAIASATNIKIDLDRLKKERPKIAEMIRKHGSN